MTIIGLAVAFAATVYLLAHMHARSLERLTALHDARLDRLVAFQREDREAWAAERRGLHAMFGTERLAWERERGVLLNRIKPETKQYVPIHIGDTPAMPSPLPYDDDSAFQKELEERVSREELAEQMFEQELAARGGVSGRTG